MEYCDDKNCISSGYEDKAEIRRKTIGSENPYEKTEVASVDIFMPELNKGYQMLKKLGWKEGDSLGLKNSGILDPISFRPWVSKAGLGSTEAEASKEPLPEDRRKRKWVKAQERYFQLSS
ncbi:Angiogenic factor with G patch and FHA like protein [Argiope bruennichi]|uniref:Angiogenic factor with G patch and FHA like protein n=2 Tax=Argiope bruennichi TaxID=94029 RepID=A0A8T0FU06_ARGBR|nr:Angiogenic factor with G patch and FHA like protein [Argiope bruennichi]